MADRMDLENEMFPKETETACEGWATLLPDAAEDLLGETEAQALDLHLAGCPSCSAELAEARRGAAWLSLLKSQIPEPPRDMVAGILARTSGAATLADLVAQEIAPVPVPATGLVIPALQGWPVPEHRPAALRGWVARWLGLDSRVMQALQPRLTMTAAMAFFSICITLNLMGISVTRLHAEDLHPTILQRSVEGKGSTLLRSLEGIRVVYRVESRVSEWLTASIAPDSRGSQQ